MERSSIISFPPSIIMLIQSCLVYSFGLCCFFSCLIYSLIPAPVVVDVRVKPRHRGFPIFFFFLNDLLLDHNNGMCFSSILSLFSYWVFPVIFSASSILSTKPNGLVCIHLRWLYTIVDRSRTVDSIARLPFLCRYKNRLLFFLPFRNIVGYRRISFATYSGRWNTREISGNTTWLW